jgi:hypothetical protein
MNTPEHFLQRINYNRMNLLFRNPAKPTSAAPYFCECAKIRAMIKRTSLLFIALLALSGCDQIAQKMGMEDPVKKDARLEPDGKAVGSACRQSGRAIEDCYAIYTWLPKSSIFSGWKEMDEYMRENKLETIVPQLPPPEAPGAAKKKKPAKPTTEGKEESKPAEEKEAAKPAATEESKSAAKH